MLAGFAVVAIAFAGFRDREPRYQDRTLSEWIKQAQTAQDAAVDNDTMLLAARAVQEMGTNAIPWLLKWSSVDDSKSKEAVISLINTAPLSPFHIQMAKDRQERARLGFELLGEAAKPAWPIFIQWTSDQNAERRILGMEYLIGTGADKEVVKPILLRLLNDPDTNVQWMAAKSFNLRFRKEAEGAGVYKLFPKLRSVKQRQAGTNQPVAN
jgi:hypothetical protein